MHLCKMQSLFILYVHWKLQPFCGSWLSFLEVIWGLRYTPSIFPKLIYLINSTWCHKRAWLTLSVIIIKTVVVKLCLKQLFITVHWTLWFKNPFIGNRTLDHPWSAAGTSSGRGAGSGPVLGACRKRNKWQGMSWIPASAWCQRVILSHKLSTKHYGRYRMMWESTVCM